MLTQLQWLIVLLNTQLANTRIFINKIIQIHKEWMYAELMTCVQLQNDPFYVGQLMYGECNSKCSNKTRNQLTLLCIYIYTRLYTVENVVQYLTVRSAIHIFIMVISTPTVPHITHHQCGMYAFILISVVCMHALYINEVLIIEVRYTS